MVPLVEQEQLIIPEHLSSPGYNGVRVVYVIQLHVVFTLLD